MLPQAQAPPLGPGKERWAGEGDYGAQAATFHVPEPWPVPWAGSVFRWWHCGAVSLQGGAQKDATLSSTAPEKAHLLFCQESGVLQEHGEVGDEGCHLWVTDGPSGPPASPLVNLALGPSYAGVSVGACQSPEPSSCSIATHQVSQSVTGQGFLGSVLLIMADTPVLVVIYFSLTNWSRWKALDLDLGFTPSHWPSGAGRRAGEEEEGRDPRNTQPDSLSPLPPSIGRTHKNGGPFVTADTTVHITYRIFRRLPVRRLHP